MADKKDTPQITPKEKRARHANAQASYMERKRAEGKEWLATWVPGEAKEAFKELAKQANSDETKPSEAYVKSVENATQDHAPDWAKENLSLFNIWLISAHNIQLDFGDSAPAKPKKDKKDKKKKKKKSD